MSPTKKYVVLILFWLGTSVSVASASDISPIISSNSKGAVLVVKTEKEMIGGKVMVFNSNKELVTVSRMKRRKLEIDFSTADFGVYTVRIVKGNELKEFHFMKK
jgi:SOS-response transcriptional repressor LexA